MRTAIRIRTFLVCLCLLLACPCALGSPQSGAPNSAAAEILSIEQATRIALENNRSVKIAALDVLRAGDQTASARTRRWPQSSLNVLGGQQLTSLSITVPRGAFGDFPATGPIPATDETVSSGRNFSSIFVARVDQPLLQLHKINLNVQQGRFAEEVARQKLRAERHRVVNDVKRLYYAALETESALDASEESLKLYREVVRVTQDYVAQQAALEGDLLEVKAKLAKEEYDALVLRNQLATRKEQLSTLLGRDVRSEYRLAPLPEPDAAEANLREAQERALLHRPEMEQARLRVRQAETAVRIERAAWIPDLSFSFLYFSPFAIDFVPRHLAQLGFSFTWEPWDWGRRRADTAEKSRAAEQASLALRDAEQQVLVDVNDKFRRLGEARALVNVTQASLAAARERLRVTRNLFAEKAALLKDVLQAQSQLAEANHAHRQAVLAVWTARTDFDKARGEEP